MASPSSVGLFGASAARCDLTGSFSLSASGLDEQTCTVTQYDFVLMKMYEVMMLHLELVPSSGKHFLNFLFFSAVRKGEQGL